MLIATDLLMWPPTQEAIVVWASIATILLFLGVSLRWGGRVAQWFLRKAEKRLRSRPPRDTMRVVPKSGYLRWSVGTVAGREANHVAGTWLVTNPMTDTKSPLVVAGVRLKLRWYQRFRLDRELSQLDSPLDLAVPWGGTDELHASFWLVPRAAKPSRDLRATLILTDQFENRRRIKVRFLAPRPPRPTPEREREQLSAISDPVEKAVASVLQAELGRYRTNGRREGGLGSTVASYNNQELTGFGGDSRRVGSPINQAIVPDPDRGGIESDNLDALLALHEGLTTDEEHDAFRSALFSRVDRDSIYAPIGYLPMLVAFELGFLPRFFEVARANLMGDDDNGFSNCLMLLDTFLRVKHSAFTEDQLDSIENVIHGTSEHPFAIPERIAAIRAGRLH